MKFRRWVVFTFAIHLLVILVDKGAGLALVWIAQKDPAVVGAAHTLGVLPFVLMAIANLGLATSLVYHLRRKGRDLQVVAETTSMVALVWGSVVGLGSFGLIYVAVTWLKPDWELNLWLALPICLCVPFLLLSSYYNSIQLSIDRIKSYNLLHLVGSVSFLPLFLLFWWLFDQTVTAGIAVARLATAMILALTVLMMLRGVVSLRPKMHWGFLREGIAFGWKANVCSTLTYLNLRLNLLILPVLYVVTGPASGNAARDLTLSQVAFYSLALTFAELVWHFPEATRDLFFSKIAGSTDEQARTLTPILCRLSLLVSVVGGLAIYPMVDPIMGGVIIPETWSKIWAEPVLDNLLILLPGTVAFTLAKILQNDLAARGHLNQCMKACGIVLAVMLAVDIYLIPTMGSKGAAIACTSGYFASSVYTLLAYKRSTGVAFHRCIVFHPSDWQYIRDIISAVFEKIWGKKR